MPTASALKATGKFVYKPETHPLMSQYLFDCIFYRYPNSSSFLLAGSYRSVAFMIREAYYLADRSKEKGFDEINLFIENMKEFNDVVHVVCGIADLDTRKILQDRLKEFIRFVAGFSVLLVVLFFAVYLPGIKAETRLIRRLVSVLYLMPRSGDGFGAD